MDKNTLLIDAFMAYNKTFPTELFPDTPEGKIFHEYYDGNFRHLGWMDIVLLKHIVKKHNYSHIILQNLNTLGKIATITKSVQVCVAYQYPKHRILPSIRKDTNLKKCKPLYKTIIFGGWNSSDDDFKIHVRAEHYMRYILVQTQVETVTYQTNKVKVIAHFDSKKNVVFDYETLS